MKGTKRGRIAKAAVVTAVGMGALAGGLRAERGVEQAIARLRAPATPTAGPAVAGTGASGSAYPVSDMGSSPAAVAQTIAGFQRNGTYTGKREYAYYGYLKVRAVVQNGSLTDVQILEYPNDNGRSHYINSIALPYLIQEAVDAQSYRVDFISGATFTSNAFVKSLREALAQAGQAVPA